MDWRVVSVECYLLELSIVMRMGLGVFRRGWKGVQCRGSQVRWTGSAWETVSDRGRFGSVGKKRIS